MSAQVIHAKMAVPVLMVPIATHVHVDPDSQGRVVISVSSFIFRTFVKLYIMYMFQNGTLRQFETCFRTVRNTLYKIRTERRRVRYYVLGENDNFYSLFSIS